MVLWARSWGMAHFMARHGTQRPEGAMRGGEAVQGRTAQAAGNICVPVCVSVCTHRDARVRFATLPPTE